MKTEHKDYSTGFETKHPCYRRLTMGVHPESILNVCVYRLIMSPSSRDLEGWLGGAAGNLSIPPACALLCLSAYISK